MGKKIKTATFDGVPYHILLDKLDGMADTHSGYWLVIERDLDQKIGLETIIHECLHACNWCVGEEKIEITARDIARFLWRLGYRWQRL